jgi:hypothetical protein
MLSLVALLYTWEEAVSIARTKLGPTLMPVVDSMLAEMGGLGFIGLFLSVVVTGGPLGSVVGHISERFLGETEILLETFEFLHTAFFEVGIVFFLIAGLTVAKVLKNINTLQDFSCTVFNHDCNGNASLEELADLLAVDLVAVDCGKDGGLTKDEIQNAVRAARRSTLREELGSTTEKIQTDALVVRERFLQTGRVSPNFRMETYAAKILGCNLEKIVELSPLTWLPLIPVLSLQRFVDMSHDVVSAASPNAAESCGFFLGSPVFFWESTVIVAVTLIWGFFNFWKVSQIKIMLMPTLVRDSACGNKATLLPPRYENEELLSEFNSSPSIVGWIEKFYAEAARNDHEALFGVAGAAGPELYRNSIKYHTWLIVCELVFWGTQIVARDISALLQGWENPDLVVPELATFGFFVALAIAQLWLAPQTFLNYSMITSVECLTDESVLRDSCKTDVEDVGVEPNDKGLATTKTNGA